MSDVIIIIIILIFKTSHRKHEDLTTKIDGRPKRYPKEAGRRDATLMEGKEQGSSPWLISIRTSPGVIRGDAFPVESGASR